jgi:sec-independent protein translocase protein TatC
VIVGTVLAWFYYDPIFAVLTGPMKEIEADARAKGLDIILAVNGIGASFTLQLRVSFMAGALLTAPFWLYQLWAFITPGLHRHERRYTIGFIAAAVPLFLAGCATAYYLLPKGLFLLLGFTPANVDNIVPIDNYLSFVFRMLIVFGIGFLAPVVVVALNFAGLLSAEALRNSWRWTFVGVLLFGAIATPDGNPLSMLTLAIPMMALLGVAYGIAWLNDRRRARRSGEPDYTDLDDDSASPIAAPAPIQPAGALDEPINSDPDDPDDPHRHRS